MDLRTDGFQSAQQIFVVVERQPWMKAVDDVNFGEGLVLALPKLGEHLLQGHRVCAGISRLEAREGTEQTRRFTDVRRLESKIVVEVGPRAVPPLALAICKPSKREQVRRVEQPDAIFERQSLASFEFVGDVGEFSGNETRAHVDPCLSFRFSFFVLRSQFFVLSSTRSPSPANEWCVREVHRARRAECAAIGRAPLLRR